MKNNNNSNYYKKIEKNNINKNKTNSNSNSYKQKNINFGDNSVNLAELNQKIKNSTDKINSSSIIYPKNTNNNNNFNNNFNNINKQNDSFYNKFDYIQVPEEQIQPLRYSNINNNKNNNDNNFMNSNDINSFKNEIEYNKYNYNDNVKENSFNLYNDNNNFNFDIKNKNKTESFLKPKIDPVMINTNNNNNNNNRLTYNNNNNNTSNSNNNFNFNYYNKVKMMKKNNNNNMNNNFIFDKDKKIFYSLQIDNNIPTNVSDFGKFLISHIEKEDNYKTLFLRELKLLKMKIKKIFTNSKTNDHCLTDYLLDIWDKLEISYCNRYQILNNIVKLDSTNLYMFLDRETEYLTNYFQITEQIFAKIKTRENIKAKLQIKTNRNQIILDDDRDELERITNILEENIKLFKNTYNGTNIIWRGLYYEWFMNYEKWFYEMELKNDFDYLNE